MNGNALNQLRDIHLPDPVSWWPPALGWWLLPVLIIATACFLYWLHRQRQRKQFIREALQELQKIEAAFQNNRDTRQLAQAVSALLRRVCITLYPRQETAAVTGENWLALLDKQLPTSEFREKFATALLTAPYQPQPQIDAAALLALCRRWINTLPPLPAQASLKT